MPEAWIPPAHVRQWRVRSRPRKTLIDERTAWLQRVQATPFHHGVRGVPSELRSAASQAARALIAPFGIGELTAPMILCELGDVARMSASRQAVR